MPRSATSSFKARLTSASCSDASCTFSSIISLCPRAAFIPCPGSWSANSSLREVLTDARSSAQPSTKSLTRSFLSSRRSRVLAGLRSDGIGSMGWASRMSGETFMAKGAKNYVCSEDGDGAKGQDCCRSCCSGDSARGPPGVSPPGSRTSGGGLLRLAISWPLFKTNYSIYLHPGFFPVGNPLIKMRVPHLSESPAQKDMP